MPGTWQQARGSGDRRAVRQNGLRPHRVFHIRARRCIYPSTGTADGVRGDHVIISPAYTVSSSEPGLIAERLGDAVDAALATGS